MGLQIASVKPISIGPISISSINRYCGVNISHVIRGQDHISNTHKQYLYYQALGATLRWGDAAACEADGEASNTPRAGHPQGNRLPYRDHQDS